ncbi:hypothetical protein GCM10027075_06370 [Streptomyces heilongjiangensis]
MGPAAPAGAGVSSRTRLRSRTACQVPRQVPVTFEAPVRDSEDELRMAGVVLWRNTDVDGPRAVRVARTPREVRG